MRANVPAPYSHEPRVFGRSVALRIVRKSITATRRAPGGEGVVPRAIVISSHYSRETAVAATDTNAHRRSAITTRAPLLADKCDLIRRPAVDFNTTTTVTEKSLLVTASQICVESAAQWWGCQAPPAAWKRFCQVTMGVASGMTLNFLRTGPAERPTAAPTRDSRKTIGYGEPGSGVGAAEIACANRKVDGQTVARVSARWSIPTWRLPAAQTRHSVEGFAALGR